MGVVEARFRRLKHVPALVAATLVSFALGCGEPRPFRIGTGFWPPNPDSVESVRLTTDRVLAAGDVVQLQLDWTPQSPDLIKRAKPVHSIAKAHGRLFSLAVDWLAADRQSLRSQAKQKWTFADSSVQESFSQSVIQACKRLNPDYFVLGVEVNFYALIDPEGFRGYVKTFHALREKMRSECAHSKIAVSFQYELLMGMHIFGTEPAETPPHPELVDYFGSGVVVGLSTYPYFVNRTPEKLPDDYFRAVLKPSRIVGIFETAWPTIENVDDEKQRTYANWILHQARKNNFEILLWTSALDTAPSSLLTASPFNVVRELPAWFSRLGLWEMNGRPKPAVGPWTAAFRTSYQSRGNIQSGPISKTAPIVP